MSYLDTCEIFRSSGVGTHREGGGFDGTQPTRLYLGPCDVQDRPLDFKRERDTGKPKVKYDVRIFLPVGDDVNVLFDGGSMTMKQNDRVKVMPVRGAVRVGRIEYIRPLDESILVRWTDVQR